MGAVFVRRPELGTKRTCVGCAARFYDLTRAPPTCPKCSAVQPPDVPRPRYAGRGNVSAGGRRAPWQAAQAAAVADEAVADVAEDEDEDADADAAVIDDDDADSDVTEIDAEIPSRPGVTE